MGYIQMIWNERAVMETPPVWPLPSLWPVVITGGSIKVNVQCWMCCSRCLEEPLNLANVTCKNTYMQNQIVRPRWTVFAAQGGRGVYVRMTLWLAALISAQCCSLLIDPRRQTLTPLGRRKTNTCWLSQSTMQRWKRLYLILKLESH